ncbi:MAG: hypothetical protein K6B68_09790, partial [Eubacterium sp.]|nr:hypothetical protein [Eubacterium sp.]
LTAIDIGAAAIGAALTPSTDFKLVIGLRPEHVRKITSIEAKKDVKMRVEMSDGNLLEIRSSYDAYNKICTWFNNNKFPQNNY